MVACRAWAGRQKTKLELRNRGVKFPQMRPPLNGSILSYQYHSTYINDDVVRDLPGTTSILPGPPGVVLS